MLKQARIGLVGLGQRGLQHLNALWQIEGAQIVALCDPYPDNLAEQKIRDYVAGFSAEGIHFYSDFDQMFAAGGLDAVYFCIPPSRHNGEVVRSAEAGLHLMVEKPVSLYLDEALEMDQAIAKAGVIATVGFQQRHDSWHIAVRDFLQDKSMVMATWVVNSSLEGHSVKHTHTENEGGPANRVWTANRAWSGSTVVEAGIHQLDLMRFWAGDVVWTQADYIHRQEDDIEDGGDNPDAYSVRFGFANGMVTNLLFSRLRKTFFGDSYQDIMWNRGHLKIEPKGPVAYYYDGPYPPEGAVDAAQLRHPLEVAARNDSTLALGQAFVEAVRRQSQAPLLNTFASSINSHAAVLGANVSDELGGERVELDALLKDDRFARFRARP